MKIQHRTIKITGNRLQSSTLQFAQVFQYINKLEGNVLLGIAKTCVIPSLYGRNETQPWDFRSTLYCITLIMFLNWTLYDSWFGKHYNCHIVHFPLIFIYFLHDFHFMECDIFVFTRFFSSSSDNSRTM